MKGEQRTWQMKFSTRQSYHPLSASMMSWWWWHHEQQKIGISGFKYYYLGMNHNFVLLLLENHINFFKISIWREIKAKVGIATIWRF